MSHLAHEFKGEVSPELEEVEETRFVLADLMLSAIKEATRLKHKERGFIRRILSAPPLAVKSPTVSYKEGEIEPEHSVAAWLASADSRETAGLYTQVVDEDHKAVTQPQLRVTAERPHQLSYWGINDRMLTPDGQLELVTNTLATVELISLEVQLKL